MALEENPLDSGSIKSIRANLREVEKRRSELKVGGPKSIKDK